MISGIAIALMLVLFLGLAAWAWSHRRIADFNEAARLALEDGAASPASETQP